MCPPEVKLVNSKDVFAELRFARLRMISMIHNDTSAMRFAVSGDKIARLTRLNLIDSPGKLCNSIPSRGTHTSVCFVPSTGGCRKWRNAKPRVVVAASTFTYHGSGFAQRARRRENFFLNLYAIIFFSYLTEQLGASQVRAPWIFYLRYFNESTPFQYLITANRNATFRIAISWKICLEFF